MQMEFVDEVFCAVIDVAVCGLHVWMKDVDAVSK